MAIAPSPFGVLYTPISLVSGLTSSLAGGLLAGGSVGAQLQACVAFGSYGGGLLTTTTTNDTSIDIVTIDTPTSGGSSSHVTYSVVSIVSIIVSAIAIYYC